MMPERHVQLLVHPGLFASGRPRAPRVRAAGITAGLEELGYKVELLPVASPDGWWTAPSSRLGKIAAASVLSVATALRIVRGGDALKLVRHAAPLAAAYRLLRLVRVRPYGVEVHATLREAPQGLAEHGKALHFASRIESACLRSAPRIVTVSDRLKRSLIEQGCEASRITVVRNGAHRSEELPVSEGADVVYAGGFLGDHRVDLLIEAFAQIASRFNVRLRLVGSTGEDELERLIETLDITDRVRWDGWCRHSEVLNRLRSAALCVLPHTDGHKSPLKLFDYLSVGRPVVVPDLANIREIVDDHHVFFFRPGSATDLARALDLALSDPERARTTALRGRQHVLEEHSWTARANQLVSALA